jgi:hypothetical protein
MPRWLPAALVVSVLVLLASAAKSVLFPAGNSRLTWENAKRIEEGMRLEEVEAILGPPGDYRTGPRTPLLWDQDSIFYASGVELTWDGDEVKLVVRLGPDDRVKVSLHLPMEPKRVGLLDLLRWRWDHWWQLKR